MNIKNLSDKQLHQNLLSLKSKESRVVASIITHLEEVYRRRLFAHYKCSSIYDYCIRILGYSNGDAHKKISACKLASRCQGVKESIANGELSLSNAASVQVFLNKAVKLQSAGKNLAQNQPDAKSIDSNTTEDLFDHVSRITNSVVSSDIIDNKTSGINDDKMSTIVGCTNIITTNSITDSAISNITSDKISNVTNDTADSTISNLTCSTSDNASDVNNNSSISRDTAATNSSSLLEKLNLKTIIDRVKNKSTIECELELEKIAKENDLKLPEIKPSKRRYGEKTMLKVLLDSEKLQLLKSRLNVECEQELLQLLVEEKLKATEPETMIKSRKRTEPSRRARSISPALRAIVIKKAQNQCENCGSKHNLQIDHKVSVTQGGGNDIENLRLLCRPCNQRAAIEQLGFECMDKYINKNLFEFSRLDKTQHIK